jgi:Tfp pilus assembly protein PilX
VGDRERAFTATGSPIKELGVPDRPASRSRRALGDERGLALPMALGVTMVLAALAAAIFTYVTMNEQSARRAGADQRAYGLAETGLSYAFSRLRNTSDPTNASAVPRRPYR